MRTVWLLLLCSSLWLTSALTYCPDRCTCSQDPNVSLVINCSSAQLHDVPTGIDENVVLLDMSMNDINTYEEQRLFKKLTRLNLSHNQLTEVSLNSRSVPGLVHLDLSHNSFSNLRNLDISQLDHLSAVDVSHNEMLNNLVRINSSSVEDLDVSHCLLHFFEKDPLANLPALKRINLSYNRLKNIISFRSATLEELDLSHGDLGVITKVQLEEFPKLKKLNLSYNSGIILSMVPTDANRSIPVTYVDLSSSDLAVVDVSAFKSLEKLHLYNNHLETIEKSMFANNYNLMVVNVSKNGIKEIHVSAFEIPAKIRVLDLSSNFVSDLAFTKYLKRAEVLKLSANKIKGLEKIFLANAIDLDVSVNDIYEILTDFDMTVPRLKKLNLALNKVEVLNALKSQSLEVLDLSNCQIITVGPDAFKETPLLRELDLTGNKLTKLDYTTLAAAGRLKRAFLSRNPWDCQCKSNDFKALYTYLLINTTLSKKEELHCLQQYNKTWIEVCRDVWTEEAISLTTSKTFYSLLTTFIVVVVLIAVVAGCRFLREHKRSREGSGRNSDLVVSRVVSTSDSPPRRASTPPPNYEDALLLPRLTEAERELAMSRTQLDTS